MSIKYDDALKCPKCDGINEIKVLDTVNMDVCEANTICQKCGHKDSWLYGFYKSPESEDDLKPGSSVYHVIMIGNEGVDGYIAVYDKKEITPELYNAMELRARMNGHRSIQGWAFTFPTKIPVEKITKELLSQLKAVKIF